MKLKVVKNGELSFNEVLAVIGQAPLKINSPEIEEDKILKPFIKWAGEKEALAKSCAYAYLLVTIIIMSLL
ncbi:hypothetical protein RHHCN13_03810 [Rickettsia conorii subsp. heilongjiangensis]|uniref:Uncharacterized protein n=2 Tax=spotted fever group TaxID=114277 RepID=A0AAD1GII3_RICCR|nr:MULTISPECIES: hypothetical protein [spotted fever group]AEK74750.1 hypothetical protein Rh054_04070 [Rickettsia conorii subsp. heilongjiangensis 054]KJW04236.1 hypothetical protein RAT170B_1377 [Rickettsia argasii T170-B]BBM91506.1 hypothetical protein RHCH81_03810 [Rickettsia conorii subsp. heilongjiangensis]BBM92715.1 hypothetical protein RHHCN13_03810 [Rickettsia conorii subsp. heilongjiangensis]BBM93924.1 hypothetical protein RHSENDAI29_03810 [Rickettsia conorii subsp. heilongjiangensis